MSTRLAGTAAGLAAISLALAAACASPVPRSHTVEIRGFAYVPATLQVAAGDTVVWINHDAVPHTATRDGHGWDSGSLKSEQTWQLVASRGNQPYYCAFHPVMRGELVVR